jgi:hypothetical protein
MPTTYQIVRPIPAGRPRTYSRPDDPADWERHLGDLADRAARQLPLFESKTAGPPQELPRCAPPAG